jgi:hypothetical protein
MSYGEDWQKELKPGILITSNVSSGGGTLGCFARLVSDPAKIVILSNSHVLFSDVASLGGTGVGAKVGQPSVSCCCCKVVANNLTYDFNQKTVTVTSPTEFAGNYTGTVIDCAIAKLNSKRPYTNEALYGMIMGTPASGSLGVVGGDHVDMVGSSSGWQKGTVLDFTLKAKFDSGNPVPSILWPAELSGPALDENFAGIPLPSILQLLILPDADPADPNRKMHFCTFGDSGSVIVNKDKLVVGIISRAMVVSDELRTILNKVLTTPLPPHAGTIGIASPIMTVISALKIRIDANMKGTAPSAGLAIDPESLEAERESESKTQEVLRSLDDEVRKAPSGREALEAVDRHRSEVLKLLHRQRRVTLAWHRNHGPAFVAHGLHSVGNPDYVIPDAIDGVTPVQLMQRMATVLRKYGSAGLVADVDANETAVCEWINGCTSIWQLVDRMRRQERALSPQQLSPEPER